MVKSAVGHYGRVVSFFLYKFSNLVINNVSYYTYILSVTMELTTCADLLGSERLCILGQAYGCWSKSKLIQIGYGI